SIEYSTTLTSISTARASCCYTSAPSDLAYYPTRRSSALSITASPSGSNLGCNPAAGSLPTDASVKGLVTATDTCSAPAITVTHADTTTGCVTTRTFSITATDACANTSAATSAAFSWTSDTSAPGMRASASGSSVGSTR